MAKILKPAVHGVLDYALALLFLLLPGVLDFPDIAATLSYIVGALYIATSALTRYPVGLWKVIPFPAHGVLESIMAVFWLAAPWLFGFADHAASRNFFLAAGIGLLAVVAITDYRSKAAAGAASLRHA
jgi:hypothetical protein